MLRVGRVTKVDSAKHRVRVNFPEGSDPDGLESDDMAVLVTRPDDYSLPPIDALVLCAVEPAGIGYVLGCLYSDEDEAPLDDADVRSIAGDDVRLGAPDASEKVALASKVGDNLDAIKNRWAAVESVVTGPPIAEPGNGSPSAFQTALAAIMNGQTYPSPTDTAAEKVSAK